MLMEIVAQLLARDLLQPLPQVAEDALQSANPLQLVHQPAPASWPAAITLQHKTVVLHASRVIAAAMGARAAPAIWIGSGGVGTTRSCYHDGIFLLETV